MLLRKLFAGLCPVLICIADCLLFRLMDSFIPADLFLSYALKGFLLGASLSLMMPAAGIRGYTNGLTGWLLLGVAVLAAVLVLQYRMSIGALHSPLIQYILGCNGQIVLLEGAAGGAMLVTVLLCRKR